MLLRVFRKPFPDPNPAILRTDDSFAPPYLRLQDLRASTNPIGMPIPKGTKRWVPVLADDAAQWSSTTTGWWISRTVLPSRTCTGRTAEKSARWIWPVLLLYP